MPGCTSVFQTFERDSWIDRIGDNRSVTDDSPGINHIVSGFRVRAVQAGASKILANHVSVIILRGVSPELLYERKVWLTTGKVVMSGAIRNLNNKIRRP